MREHLDKSIANKEKILDSSIPNNEDFDVRKVLNLSDEEASEMQEKMDDISRNSIPDLTKSAVNEIITNMKEQYQKLGPGNIDEKTFMEAIGSAGVRINMVDAILTPLLTNLTIGQLLAAGINACVSQLRETIVSSVELSVLGTFQNIAVKDGNKEVADVLGEMLKLSLAKHMDNPDYSIGTFGGEPQDESMKEFINDAKLKKGFDANTKHDDDDAFQRFIKGN